jgi:hypothetical protein
MNLFNPEELQKLKIVKKKYTNINTGCESSKATIQQEIW